MSALSRALAGHRVEVQTYRPGVQFNYSDKDLIILSGGGGEGLEIDDEYEPGRLWYEDEIRLIHMADKPILGICMGFEVMAKAYGAPVTKAPRLIQGKNELQVSKDFRAELGKKIQQYEAHSWRVMDAPANFEVLATSGTGVEVFRYKNRLATQFHPEKGGSLEIDKLLQLVTHPL